jgi:hypothetical protein
VARSCSCSWRSRPTWRPSGSSGPAVPPARDRGPPRRVRRLGQVRRAIFDPSGGSCSSGPEFRLASFGEPVVTADAIYIRLDPWALLEGGSSRARSGRPAPTSSSPRCSRPRAARRSSSRTWTRGSRSRRGGRVLGRLPQLPPGGVSVSAHGTINAGTVARTRAPHVPPARGVRLEELRRPEPGVLGPRSRCRASTTRSDGRPDPVRHARGDRERRAGAAASGWPARSRSRPAHPRTSRFPAAGRRAPHDVGLATAESLRSGAGSATEVRARIRGILRVDTLSFSPRQLEVTAGSATGEGARCWLRPSPRLVPGDGHSRAPRTSRRGSTAAGLGARTSTSAAKSADITFDALVSPALLAPISAHFGFDIRRFADLAEPVAVSGQVRLSPGWKFADAEARVDGRNFTAYGVMLRRGPGRSSFDGTRLAARGPSPQRRQLGAGLLRAELLDPGVPVPAEGRLRPLDISPWFHRGLVDGIFKSFGFPVRPPTRRRRAGALPARRSLLGVRLRGLPGPGRCWASPSTAPAPSSTSTSRPARASRSRRQGGRGRAGLVQARLRARDGRLELARHRRGLDARPRAGRQDAAARGAPRIAAFSFDAPVVSVRGHFRRARGAGRGHKELHTEVRSDSGLRVHGVAFDRASFKVDMKDDDIDVSDVDAGFAGGPRSGRPGHRAPRGADRRLRFKASLTTRASARPAEAAEGYVVSGKPGARRRSTPSRGRSPTSSSTSTPRPRADPGTSDVQRRRQRPDPGGQARGAVAAGGPVQGPQVPRAALHPGPGRVQDRERVLSFPDLSVIGANSAIEAKGTYSIDRRVLDFSAPGLPLPGEQVAAPGLQRDLGADFAVFRSGSPAASTSRLGASPTAPEPPRAAERR